MAAPRTQKISIPFTQGLQEGIDSRLLPLGQFAQLQNARYTRDGRLSTRKGYVTLGTDVDSGDGTLQVFDLHTMGNRVFARGNTWGDGYPTNLFELVEHSTATWREVITDLGYPTLNPFQDVKHLPLLPSMVSGATRSQIAACNGYLCVVFYNAFLPNFCNVQILRASNGQLVAQTLLSGQLARVCTVATGTGSDRAFVIVLNDTAANLCRGHVFDPNTNTTGLFTALGALHTADGVIRCFDVAEVVGASTFMFAVATTTSNQVRVYNYTLAGAQNFLHTIAATNATSVAVEGDNAAQNYSTLIRTSAPAVQLRTTTFGAVVTGPTTLFGAEVLLVTADDQVRICRLPANSRTGQGARVVCLANVRGALNLAASGPLQTADIALDIRSTAAHAALTNGWTKYNDMVLEGHVVALPQVASPGARNAFVFSASIGEAVARTRARTSVLVFSDANLVEHQAAVRERITLTAEASCSYDASTGRVHWSSYAQATDQETQKVSVFTSALVNGTGRITSAGLAGSLYLAGGCVQGYDGFMPKEVGFLGIPGIRHTQNSIGGLAPLNTTGSYDFVVTWSWVNSKGDLERSAPSDPVTVTMSAGTNNCVLQVNTPRSLVQLIGAGITCVNVETWRTVWDAVNGVKLTGFRKDSVLPSNSGITNLGSICNVGPALTDAALASQELLYTDAGSGALSGALPRVAAPAAAFLSVVGSRLQLAGLPDRTRYCESLSKIPGRALCFPPNALRGVGYYNEAAADIIGAASTDAGRLLFTEKDIYIAPGPGATEDGQGQIPSALGIGTDLPLRNVAGAAAAMLRTKDGVWYQADSDKLCLMPLGGGLPEWKGQEVRNSMQTLAPTVVGSAQCLSDDCVYFGANGSGSTTRVFVRDHRTGVWYIDTLPATASLIRAVATHNGVPIFVRANGTVQRMSAAAFADVSSTPIVSAWQTGYAQMGGLGGWQEIVSIVVKVRWLADCSVSLFIAHDQGAAAIIGTVALNGLTVGATFPVLFTPKRRKCNQFALIGGVTPTLATEGADILGIELELLPQSGPARLPRSRRI